MRVAIFCHPSTELWSPHSLEAGIGGSEEAVIHMAVGLARCGHEVTVVNTRQGPIRHMAGVAWSSYESRPAKTADVGIIWRRSWRIDQLAGAARRFYLWLHDFIPESDVLPRVAAFHKVMVLSRFHRQRYPSLSSDRIFMTSNGVGPDDFSDRGVHDPQLMVYGSCYSRGLHVLLTHWRSIRAAVPSARLRIFYGWQTIEKTKPEQCRRLRRMLAPLMAQEGITHLGRIGHQDVAREYAAAGIWAYPCLFAETSCISAMKAQAAGAVPVVISSGALRETVNFGFKTMRGRTDFAGLPTPPRIVEEWLAGLIDMLRSPERQARIRREMIPASRRRFAWTNVVEQWEREFRAARS